MGDMQKTEHLLSSYDNLADELGRFGEAIEERILLTDTDVAGNASRMFSEIEMRLLL